MKKQHGPARLSHSGGFTLIELLVVIAIIGILAAVILAALGTAQAKGRDSQRQSDLKEVQTALQLYSNDHNGNYPSTSGAWWGNCSGFGSYSNTGSTGYIPNLAPTYIGSLPLDPRPLTTSSCYLYKSDGVDYMFLEYGTVEGTVPTSLDRPSAPTEKDYAVYTPGAANW